MPRNKTVISAILLICTVLSLAAPACCEEDPYLTSITLTEDRGHDQSPAIPDSIDGNPVTRIGERCFTGNEEIESIIRQCVIGTWVLSDGGNVAPGVLSIFGNGTGVSYEFYDLCELPVCNIHLGMGSKDSLLLCNQKFFSWRVIEYPQNKTHGIIEFHYEEEQKKDWVYEFAFEYDFNGDSGTNLCLIDKYIEGSGGYMKESLSIKEFDIYDVAVSHISDHTGLTKDQLEDFCWSAEYLTENAFICRVTFYYTPLSSKGITIEINAQKECTNCTCQGYTLENYRTDIQYKQMVWPSVEIAMEWEESYGPHELWDVETNASFYNLYGYIPYYNELEFEEHTSLHYDSAINESISELEAVQLANQALIQKYPDAEKKMKELKIGSYFVQLKSESSFYCIQYYLWNNEQWAPYYLVHVLSDTGLCIHIQIGIL